ncbi:dimethyl sulfoxide reductase anchor subunit [Rahnella sp. BCC 1045]|uniref:dimethyl sulfoxide reductase anchor subunit family protein n=1 Tax=Rahnella sp. BCC 1045 TaxID=2816251 RepID=UPI001C258E1E|nr:DmsC/YnfH family molybdoenzyme membrane anchor subunit [Rahnella sp. BCC 1045]MBU9819721.1 dimethyl sulfoxide reductase anchor subunit [Rahnella sp. BCC 1045]
MHEWPLIIFTLLIQSSVGITLFTTLILISGADKLSAREKHRLAQPAMLTAFIAGALGLIASTAHLGYPLNALHALSHFSSSWLSREIVFASAYLAALGLATLIALLTKRVIALLMVIAVAMGAVDIFCMSAIYVNASVVTWMHFNTYVMFGGTALTLGAVSGMWTLAARPMLAWGTVRRLAVMSIGVLIAITVLRLLVQPVYGNYLASLGGADLITFPHQPLEAYGQMAVTRFAAWALLIAGACVTALSLHTQRFSRLRLLAGAVLILIAEVMLRFNFFSIH